MNRSARCSNIVDAAFCGMAPDATSAATSASNISSSTSMRVPASAAVRASLFVFVIV